MARNMKTLPQHLQSAALKLVQRSQDPIDVLVTKILRQFKDVFAIGDEVHFHADNKLTKGEIVGVHPNTKPVNIDLTEEAAGSPSNDKENCSADTDVHKYNVKVKGKTVCSIPAEVLSRAGGMPSKSLVKKFVLSKANFTPETPTCAAQWGLKGAKNTRNQLASPPSASKKSKASKAKTPVQKNTLDSFVKIARTSKSNSSPSPKPDVGSDSKTPSKSTGDSDVVTDCKSNQESAKTTKTDKKALQKKSIAEKPREKSKKVVSKRVGQTRTKTVGKVPKASSSITWGEKPKKMTAKVASRTPTKSNALVAQRTPMSARKLPSATSSLKQTPQKMSVIDVTDSDATNLLDDRAMESEVMDDDIHMVSQDQDEVVCVQVAASAFDGSEKLTREPVRYLVNDSKKTPGTVSASIKRASVVMKQLTLFDLTKHSGVTSADAFASMTPPTPKVIRKYRKAVKENNAVQQSRQLLFAARKLTDQQKSRLPPDLQALITKKREILEEKEKMKGLSAEERRRLKQQQTDPDRKETEDLSLAGSADLPEPKVLSLPLDFPNSLLPDLLYVTQFCVSFRGFLWPPETAKYDALTFDELARCIISKDFKALDVMMSLLRTLLNDFTFSEAEELSTPLNRLPLNQATALGLLYLTFDNIKDKRGRSAEEKAELEELMVAIKSAEYAELSPSTVVDTLKMLCTLLLDTQGIVDHLSGVHERVLKAWKARNDVMKLQTDFTMKHGLHASTEGGGKGDADTSTTEQTPVGEESIQPQTLTDVLKLRRKMAKKSAEDRERKEVELRQQREINAEKARLEKQKQSADLELQDALLARDLSKRVNCLGMDRHYNRYWVFPGQPGLLVERGWTSDDSMLPIVDVHGDSEPEQFVTPESYSYGWLHYDSLKLIDLLFNSLNPAGVREGELHSKLGQHYSAIEESFKSSSSKMQEKENVVELSVSESFKEALEELEDSIKSAGLGSVHNYDEWTDSLREAVTVEQLGEHLLRCQAAVHKSRFCGIMSIKKNKLALRPAGRETNGGAESVLSTAAELEAEGVGEIKDAKASESKTDEEDAAESKTDGEKAPESKTDGEKATESKTDEENAAESKTDEEKATDQLPVMRRRVFDWQTNVRRATSASMLHVLLEILRMSIDWGKSIKKVRCKICSRKGNGETLLLCDRCDDGFHMYCVAIEKADVPVGGWLCSICNPSVRRNSRPTYVDEIEESSEEEEEEMCDVCNKGGQNIVLCDTCLSGYHITCHQPPLRLVPRFAWTCHKCKFGVRRLDKARQGDSSPSLEESEDELRGKGTKGRYLVMKTKASPLRYKGDESDTTGRTLRRNRSDKGRTSTRSSKRTMASKDVHVNMFYGESDASSSEDLSTHRSNLERKKDRVDSRSNRKRKSTNDRQSPRRKAAAKARDAESDGSEDETDEEIVVKPPSKRKERESKRNKSRQETVEEVKVKPSTKQHSKKKGDKKLMAEVKDKKKHSQRDDSATGRKLQKKTRSDEKTTSKPRIGATRFKRVRYNEADSESDENEHNTDEEVKVRLPSKRHHKEVSEESDCEGDQQARAGRPSRKKGKKDEEVEKSRSLPHQKQPARSCKRRTAEEEESASAGDRTETDDTKKKPRSSRRDKTAKKDAAGQGQLTLRDCNQLTDVQLHKALKTIHHKLWTHRTSWPFEYPVDATEVPDYYKVITKPMDLTTILSKLECYTAEKFVEDVRQMIFNSFDYNTKDSTTAKLTVEFEKYFVKLLAKYLPHIKYSSQKTLFGL